MAGKTGVLDPQSRNAGRGPHGSVYPVLEFERIKDPNRFWAIPIFGGLVKIIILIPVFIEVWFLMIAVFITSIINSFVVLFTGKYWKPNFDLLTSTVNVLTKTALFFVGLTNKYPGFRFTIEDNIKLSFVLPQHPSRFFATPILGGLARVILLIPYFIYTQVIGNGAWFGAIIGSFPVLFSGRYPESIYEISKDSVRLTLSSMLYFGGVSDSYPSFRISMNHKTIKILLIIVGVLMLGNQSGSKHNSSSQNYYRYQQQYNQMQDNSIPQNSQKVY